MKTFNNLPANTNGNREDWLQAAVELMTDNFIAAGYKVPEIRVSCGFPSRGATSMSKLTIGQCWSSASARDGRAQIFISPLLEDNITVLATLVHEVVHAVVGTAAGHGATFRKCAVLNGLTGKMTATVSTPSLRMRIRDWVRELGDYPHAQLSAMRKVTQSTRLIKCVCEECGYTVRTTAKWLGALGTPICPCNNESMAVSE